MEQHELAGKEPAAEAGSRTLEAENAALKVERNVELPAVASRSLESPTAAVLREKVRLLLPALVSRWPAMLLDRNSGLNPKF